MEQRGASFHLFTDGLEASIKATNFVHNSVGYFTVLYFSNSSEFHFSFQKRPVFKDLSL